MNSRYIIKYFIVAYEIPTTEVTASQESVDELQSVLTSIYEDWFDVILCNIAPYELPNLNGCYLYQLVVRVDTMAISKSDMELAWGKYSAKVESAMESFLKKNNILFNKLS